MSAVKKWSLLLVASAVTLGGCLPQEDKEDDPLVGINPPLAECVAPAPAVSAICAAGEQELTDSNGRTLCLALSTVAEAPFMQGFYGPAKVQHRVTVKDASGAPLDLLAEAGPISAIEQRPMMTMWDSECGVAHRHTTAYETAAVNNGDGSYDLTAFYVMGSMGGYWEYNVVLNDSVSGPLTATFIPELAMPMGAMYRSAELNNAADIITAMDMESGMAMELPRKYFVWVDALTSNADSSYDLRLFVSTIDMVMSNMMMQKLFPAVYVGQTLHDETATPYQVGTVALQMVDNGQTVTLTADANGYYVATGLLDLVAGSSNTISLSLTVDGLAMKAEDGSDPMLIFNVPN